MIILNDLEIVDLGLWHSASKTLIVSDLHIGYEKELHSKGILVPKFQFKDVKEHLVFMLQKVKPETIVITGDLKHEFGRVSEEEWRNTLLILDFLSSSCKKLIVIKGNHDLLLEPITKKRKIEILNQYCIDNLMICHGDEKVKLSKEIKTLVIGHEHCAVSLFDRIRTEKFKCFLVGKIIENRRIVNLICMPSLNTVTTGTDVLTGKLLSPYLKKDISSFKVYVITDDHEVLEFGKISRLREEKS